MKHKLGLRLSHLLAGLQVMKAAIPLAWALALALCSPAVSAATRTVTNLNDNGPGSLRDTILASASGDTINFFGGGTIVLTNGELAIGRSLTIVGPAAGVTVSGNDRSRVFNIVAGTIILSNLVVSSGRVAGTDGEGGPAQGGGLLNSGNLSLINCRLHTHVAVGGRGGNQIINKDGGSAAGGAICNLGSLTLLNCTFDSNSAKGGDGALADGPGKGGNAYGGAICNFGNLTLLNCTLDSNSAKGGAGAYADWGGNGGDASGGAVFNLSTASLVNCTLNRGSASGGPGGISRRYLAIGGAGGNADGGGLSDHGTAALRNTILSCSVFAGLGGSSVSPFDVGPNGSATGPAVSGAVVSQGHNLVGQADGSSGWEASDLTGTVTAPLDPQLGPLQDNGGPVPTMALLPTSVAIDAGDDAVLGPPSNLFTDARGFVRRTSDHVDIGAYEFSTITRLVTTMNDSGGGSLRNAIGVANPFDRILFAGIVRGTIRLTSGELLVNKPLSIVGPDAPLLAISGNTNSRVFHIGPQGNVAIHGLTITEGRVVEANGLDATSSSAATPGGYALGGGVFNEGILMIFDSMIVSNSVQGGRGGSGYVYEFRRFPGETGGPAVGAGIYSTGPMEAHRCTLTGNRALGGTGGTGGDSVNPANATAAGTGGYASGAGAYTATGLFEDCTVAANRSTGGQGGRAAQAGQSLRAGGSGGPAAGGGLSGGLALINCSVSGNSVTGGMGGIGSTDGPTGATYAGGVNVVQLNVQSTIIAGNTGSANSTDVLGTVTSQGWNLIGITDGSSGWTTDDFLGNSSFPLDARLRACQDNGGPVWTMRPQADSPARDAGRSALATDARGSRRVVDFVNVPNAPGGDGSDIGAFELQVPTLLLTGPVKSGNDMVVRFASESGERYRIERKDTLASNVWTTVADNLPGTGGIMSVTDPGAAGQPRRFYRGQVLP